MRNKYNLLMDKLYFFGCKYHYIFAQLKCYFNDKQRICFFGYRIYAHSQVVYQGVNPSLVIPETGCPTSKPIGWFASKN